MFPKSIRWRIQAWHGFLLVCVIGALVGGFYSYERRVSFRELDAQLHANIAPLLPRLAPLRPPHRDGEPSDNHRPRPPRHGGDDQQVYAQLGTNFYYVTWSPNRDIANFSANAPADVPYPEPMPTMASPIRARGEFQEIVRQLPNGYVVLLGTSTAPVEARLSRLAVQLVGIGVLIVGVGFFGGWWLTGRAIRPIAEITTAARIISDGNLSKRINVKETESELGQLATVLNDTFKRLEESFEQQVRFTADASHELRTPVAVILTQTQLALSRERTAEEYRQTLQTCERAAERMRTLVNQLLELARVDAGEDTLVPEKCDLARVVHEAVELIQPLAHKRNSVIKSSLQPVSAKIDPMKLGQVLINLLNNAIHHNNDGVEVHVTLEELSGHAVIRVRDNGCGIPSEALPHLFDRFFRVDKSRSRGKGNSGLGLAICKAIVEAHRGTISVQSKQGFGTEFKIDLPLTRPASEKSRLLQ